MIDKFHSLARYIVLTPLMVDQKVREKALELLLEYEAQKATKPLADNVRVVLWAWPANRGLNGYTDMSRFNYNLISAFLKATLESDDFKGKLNAIKHLRTLTGIGLGEAKITVENWNFNL